MPARFVLLIPLLILLPILLPILMMLSTPARAEGPTGACFRDPNASVLQGEWKRYFELQKKRAQVNLKTLVSGIRLDEEALGLIRAVSEVEPLIAVLDELEKNFLKKAFVDPRFNDVLADPEFAARLESRALDEELRSSKLPFKDDPLLYSLLDRVREELRRPEVKEAIERFRSYDLGVLETRYRQSAKRALDLIRKKGTPEQVRSWTQDPPFLRNVPLPPLSLGPFSAKYRLILSRSVASYVLTTPIELAQAKKVFPRIRETEVQEINTAQPPTEKNAFDEYVYRSGGSDEAASIDGVARTLWGEASSCQSQGLAQFEAIARIIADRAIAVCRAKQEKVELETKNDGVREKNWKTFLSNWVGIKRPAPGMQNKLSPKLRGMSDFGRPEKSDIACAAQVISKKNQFSVWNSFSLKRFRTGVRHPNIPDAVYEIQGPQAENDDRALVRILCPELKTDRQRALWAHAEALASEIVRSPELLAQRIRWTMPQPIFFYTHDAELPFAKEVQAPNLLVNGKKLVLRKAAGGPCNHFRLFVPRVKTAY